MDRINRPLLTELRYFVELRGYRQAAPPELNTIQGFKLPIGRYSGAKILFGNCGLPTVGVNAELLLQNCETEFHG
jgi:hypothetical protein